MSNLNIALLTGSQHPTLGAFILHNGCALSAYEDLDKFLVDAVSENFDVVICDDKFLSDENTEDRLFRFSQRNRNLSFILLSEKISYYKLISSGSFHHDDLSSLKKLILGKIEEKKSSLGVDDIPSSGDEIVIEVDEESEEPLDLLYACEDLKKSQSLDELAKSLLMGIKSIAPQKRALILKYLPNYCSLVVLGGAGFKTASKYSGVGLNFSTAKDFNPKVHLSKLEGIPAFQKILQKVFSSQQVEQISIEVEQVPRLLMVLEGTKGHESYSKLKTLALMAEERASHLSMKTLYYNVKSQDELTGLLSREKFFEMMQDEYMRARRIFLPVTSVMIEIDKFTQIKETYNTERLNTLLKMTAKILKENVRHNDFIGKLSDSRFGLLFPHMSVANAKVKVEKLRKVFLQTKFFSDMKTSLSLSMSMAHLTYPQYSHSADEAVIALENSLEQNEFTDAIIGLKAREGFRPDFEEIELPFSRRAKIGETAEASDVSKVSDEHGVSDVSGVSQKLKSS